MSLSADHSEIYSSPVGCVSAAGPRGVSQGPGGPVWGQGLGACFKKREKIAKWLPGAGSVRHNTLLIG